MKDQSVTIPNQYFPLLAPEVAEVVEPSGRCSAKSTSNEVVAIRLMLQDRKNKVWSLSPQEYCYIKVKKINGKANF